MTPRNARQPTPDAILSEPRRPQRLTAAGPHWASQGREDSHDRPPRPDVIEYRTGRTRPWPEPARQACARLRARSVPTTGPAGSGGLGAPAFSRPALGAAVPTGTRRRREHHSRPRTHSPRPLRPARRASKQAASQRGRRTARDRGRPGSTPGSDQGALGIVLLLLAVALGKLVTIQTVDASALTAAGLGQTQRTLSDLRPARIHRGPQRSAAGLHRRRQADRGTTRPISRTTSSAARSPTSWSPRSAPRWTEPTLITS